MSDLPGSQSMVNQAQKYAPWRKNVSWVVILIQGIVLAVIGGLILLRSETAGNVVVLLIALYVAFVGLLQVLSVMRASDAPAGQPRQFGLVRAGVALAVGIICAVLVFIPEVSVTTVGGILSLGLVIIGALGLIGAIFVRGGAPFRFAALLPGIVYLALGIMLFLILNGTIPFSTFGWLTLILGVVLVVVAIMRRRDSAAAPAAAA